jgi:hypothetical protein
MSRLVPCLAAVTAALTLVGPALAADWTGNAFGSDSDLRSGFSEEDWANSDVGGPIDYQLGARYWYSWGAQSFGIGGGLPALTENDNTHAAEIFGRVNDESTGYYAKAIGGLSFKTSGTYSGFDSGSLTGGYIGYAGADLGYSWLGNFKSPAQLGPFVGYMYWNDSPNASTTSGLNSFTTATSAADIGYDPTTGATSFPGDSTANKVEVNMLRVGLSGQARLGSMVDLTGEVAAVPYANLHGVLGSVVGAPTYNPMLPGGIINVGGIQASPTSVDGWGYGAMAEAFVGFHPTDHINLKLGGRAWYLQGTADTTFARATIGNPSDSDIANPPNYDTAPSFSRQDYITRQNPWSLFRYGLLTEFSYSF